MPSGPHSKNELVNLGRKSTLFTSEIGREDDGSTLASILALLSMRRKKLRKDKARAPLSVFHYPNLGAPAKYIFSTQRSCNAGLVMGMLIELSS